MHPGCLAPAANLLGDLRHPPEQKRAISLLGWLPYSNTKFYPAATARPLNRLDTRRLRSKGDSISYLRQSLLKLRIVMPRALLAPWLQLYTRATRSICSLENPRFINTSVAIGQNAVNLPSFSKVCTYAAKAIILRKKPPGLPQKSYFFGAHRHSNGVMRHPLQHRTQPSSAAL